MISANPGFVRVPAKRADFQRNCFFTCSGRLSRLRDCSEPYECKLERSEIIELRPSNSKVRRPFGTVSSWSAVFLKELMMSASSPSGLEVAQSGLPDFWYGSVIVASYWPGYSEPLLSMPTPLTISPVLPTWSGSY